MTFEFPEWAEWTVLRWSQGQSVKEIHRELSEAAPEVYDWTFVSVMIETFLMAAWPKYTSNDEHGVPHLTVTREQSRELARVYFDQYPKFKSPDDIFVELSKRRQEQSRIAKRRRQAAATNRKATKAKQKIRARQALICRVRDPDEPTAPRDVWMTYMPGPWFDFMEPVRK